MSDGRVEVFGRYVVHEQLGAGGMARVDRAELAGGEGAGRQIALKRMLPHVAAKADMVEAFVREARLLKHLRHGNIAQTYEFGQVDGVHFIAMELVTGPTLREVLQHGARTTGPMPVSVALNLLNQLCDALDYAHNLCDETGRPLGIIHRDVSPSNIIIDGSGVAKLIDFGIAKVSTGMQTVAGIIKGKFGYMAPEYLAGGIDARADLFAVGVIAHELLTNRPLFSVADDMETMRRMRSMPIEPPSRGNRDVPPEIDNIVMTALSRDPAGRWQHATALTTALTTLTRRLGLLCTNQQVIEWIAWAFAQTSPPGAQRPSSAHEARERAREREREPAEPSMSVHIELLEQVSLSDATVLDPGPPPESQGAPTAGPRVHLELLEQVSLSDATVLDLGLPPESQGASTAGPHAPVERARLAPAPQAPSARLPSNSEMTLLGPVGPRASSPRASSPRASSPRASSPVARPPALQSPQPLPPQPLPRQPLPLQPLPYHPRRGTTGSGLPAAGAAATSAPGVPTGGVPTGDEAAASGPGLPATGEILGSGRRRSAIAVLALVLLAAGLAGAGVYLVLLYLA